MRTNFFHTSSNIPNLIEEGNLRRVKRKVNRRQSKERKSEQRQSKERQSKKRKSEQRCTQRGLFICALVCSVVSKHQIPIGQMGNYQEHLKRINPLRELDSGSVKTQLFGNPFKLEKASDKVRFRCIATHAMCVCNKVCKEFICKVSMVGCISINLLVPMNLKITSVTHVLIPKSYLPLSWLLI